MSGAAGDGRLGSGLLEDFLRRLLSATTVSAAGQAAVDTVREALSSDVSWCGVTTGDFLTMAAYSGLRTAEMTALWKLQVGQGVGGRVAAEGRTMTVRDYRRDPRRVPVMKTVIDDEGIRGSVCAPLVSDSEVLGVLYAANRAPRDWTVQEVQFVTGVACDTGVALARIRDRHRDRLRADEAEQLAGAASHCLEAVGAIATCLASTEDIGAGIGVLAYRLGMHLELLAPGGELLREAPPSTGRDEPVRMQVDVGDEPLGTLRIRCDREPARSERELVDLATQLIALQLLRERAALQTELRVHSEFLDDLLEGHLEDRHGVNARAALLGVDLKTPRYVVCIGLRPMVDGSDGHAALTRRSFTQIEQGIRAHFPASAVAPRGGDAVILLEPAASDLKQIHRVLCDVVRDATATPQGLAAGLGRMCLGLDDYADSYTEASLALDLARRRAQPGEVLSPADLGFYGLLARGSTRQSMESMVEGVLGPLLEADTARGSEYVKTLDAYLASDRHLERAATSLHVHPNTVRYRLAKVQDMLGVNLRDVDDRFLLELALRVQAALERR